MPLWLIANRGKIIIGLVILGLLVWAGLTIKDHFDHIKEIEQANVELKADKETLTNQKAQLVQLNQQNQQSLNMIKEQIKENTEIANQERAAAAAREASYKDIRNAIKSSTSPVQPVSPVVSDTLERLWSGTN